MKHNLKLILLMSIILLIGGITYDETEKEINIRETEEIKYDTVEKHPHKTYMEKYIELYKNIHEPHNKHKIPKISKKNKKT